MKIQKLIIFFILLITIVAGCVEEQKSVPQEKTSTENLPTTIWPHGLSTPSRATHAAEDEAPQHPALSRQQSSSPSGAACGSGEQPAESIRLPATPAGPWRNRQQAASPASRSGHSCLLFGL